LPQNAVRARSAPSWKTMCSDNPNLPKEANKAKCFVIACFVFSFFSMLGFVAGITGVIGAICGILACVAASILMCCAPKSADEGAVKFTTAMALLLIAGIGQFCCGIAVIAWMVAALNKTNESSWCTDRYVDCTTDSDGMVCADSGYGADAMCYKECVGDDYCGWGQEKGHTHCEFRSSYDTCETIHGGVKDAVSGIIILICGIAVAFLFIAGILNTIGGYYCSKAKNAMAGPKAIAPSN